MNKGLIKMCFIAAVLLLRVLAKGIDVLQRLVEHGVPGVALVARAGVVEALEAGHNGLGLLHRLRAQVGQCRLLVAVQLRFELLQIPRGGYNSKD